MKYKAVIFDLDGVICNTDRFHYQAWKAIADQEKIPFDESVNNRLRGVSRMESLEIILEKAGRSYTATEKQCLADKKNELYRGLLSRMTPADLPSEVRAVLIALKMDGVRVAIGSSSKNTGVILDHLGITGQFDAISDGNGITHSKPDPEVFLNAAGMLHLAPAECLVVEDAVSGIEAAARGGFDSAGLGAAASCGKTTYPLRSISDLLMVVRQ